MPAKPLLTLNAGDIHIGPDRVTIKYTGQDGSPLTSNHMVIDDIREGPDGPIVINVGDKPLPLVGCEITVYCDRKNGYVFKSRVLEVTRLPERKGMPVWLIERPTEARPHKQRRTFRVDASLPVVVSWVGQDRDGSTKMTITDLSVRGCRTVISLSAKQEFDLHHLATAERYWLTLPVPEKFLAQETKRQIRAKPHTSNGAEIDPEAIKSEIRRKFERFPVVVRLITKRQLPSLVETLLVISWEFNEFTDMNRLVRWLEIEALRKINPRRLRPPPRR